MTPSRRRIYYCHNSRRLVAITEKKRLSVVEYDELAEGFLISRPWLQDKDGKGLCGSIMVTARGRSPLVIQPEGYDYARYVALA